MLDLRGADNRGDHRAQLLQRQAQADDGVRPGEHLQAERQEGRHVHRQGVQIGGDKGGGVDQAKTGHAQHAVQVVGSVVAVQIIPDELFVVRLRINGRRLSLDRLIQMSIPAWVQPHAGDSPLMLYGSLISDFMREHEA